MGNSRDIEECSQGWLALIWSCVAAKRLVLLHVLSLAPTCVPSPAQTVIVIALLS